MTTELLKLTDAEASAVESQIGYLVCIIGRPGAHTFKEACEIAADLARHGGRVGVFKVCAVAEPETVKAEALPSAALVEQARSAKAGVR